MAADKKIMKPQPGAGHPKVTIFKARQRERLFAWHEVDHALIVAAFCGCLDGGHALMLSSAMGGRGVCIRIMKGRNVEGEVEYAGSAWELNEWLKAIAEGYQSGSEDLVEVMRSGIAATAAAAD
jgi:hypothetical protein